MKKIARTQNSRSLTMNEWVFLFLNRPWCVAEFQRVNVVGSDGTSCDNKNVLIPGRELHTPSVSMNTKTPLNSFAKSVSGLHFI